MKAVLLEVRAKHTDFMRSEAAREVELLEKTADRLKRAYEQAAIFDLATFMKLASQYLSLKSEIPTKNYLQVLQIARDAFAVRTDGMETAINGATEAAEMRRSALTEAETALTQAIFQCDEQIRYAEAISRDRDNQPDVYISPSKLPKQPVNYWLTFPALLFVSICLLGVRGCTWLFMTIDPSKSEGFATVGWIIALVILVPILGGIGQWIKWGIAATDVRSRLQLDAVNDHQNAITRAQATKESATNRRKTLTESGAENVAKLKEEANRATNALATLQETIRKRIKGT